VSEKFGATRDEKEEIRTWWGKVGAIKVPNSKPLRVQDEKKVSTSIVIAYLLAHGMPVHPMWFLSHEPRTLMLMDVILGPKGRAFQVTEDPFWDEVRGNWSWKQERVYAATWKCRSDNRKGWVTAQEGWKIITLSLARHEKPEAGLFHARQMIRKVLDSEEPQKWAGRIITHEWVMRNIPEGGDPHWFIDDLASIAIFGHPGK